MRKAYVPLRTALLGTALMVSFVATSHSQTRETFVISARAGGVNAVTGGASMRAHGNSEWQQLTIKEDLETGDVVKTGTDGRVEMLLNPGSYLRIAENSEFELTNSSLENLEVKLIRGTAIVEATGAENTALLINITTPHTKLAIVQRGLYRLNVVPGDATELIVRKGIVMLDRTHAKIKGGNKVIFNNESFFIAKLDKVDKKKVDSVDTWSKERAGFLAQANQKIKNRDLNLMLASFDTSWSRFTAGSAGIWFFNPRFACFTFLPFYMGWNSPYGSFYANSFYSGYYGPYWYGGYYPPVNASSANPTSSSGTIRNLPTGPAPTASAPQPGPTYSEPRASVPEGQPRAGRIKDQ